MGTGDAILEAFKQCQKADPDGIFIPQAFVETMLETERRGSYQRGQKDEREELVCRLLACNMDAAEISLILKIRAEDIQDIEKYNGKKIADYAKKLKLRRKSRERAAANKC